MGEWETIPTWEPGRSGQIMTARWLNRVQNNLDWLNAFASWGASPFRSVTIRGTSLATWGTLWQGWYRHHHGTITTVYSVWRGDEISFDDDPAFSPRSDYMANGAGTAGSPSYIEARILVGANWGTIFSTSHQANQANTGTSVATSGLGLTPGGLYKVAVLIRNGGFQIGRLHGEGGACGYTWGNPPNHVDGIVQAIGTIQTSGTPLGTPVPVGWNTYRHLLLYLKELMDAPRGPTQGVYDKPGRHGGNSVGSVAWVGRIRHRGDKVLFRIGSRALDSNTNPGGWAELYYNNTLIGTAQCGVNDSSYHYTEGTANPGTLGLTKGNYYDVELRTRAEQSYDFRVLLDYCFEINGEPLAAIRSTRWTHGTPVRGDSGTPRVGTFKNDLDNIKGTVEQNVQFLCPDLQTGWPTVDLNDLTFVRQRPTLVWGGSGGTANGGTVTLKWGPVANPNQQALGAATGPSTADLRGFDGLGVGTVYWLSPRENVTYALEQ